MNTIGAFMRKVQMQTPKQPALQEKVAKALLDQWLADDRNACGAKMATAALRVVATHLNVSFDALERGDVRLSPGAR